MKKPTYKIEILALSDVNAAADPDEVGSVHLINCQGDTACGYELLDFVQKGTTKPITCLVCAAQLQWAKQVAKIKG